MVFEIRDPFCRPSQVSSKLSPELSELVVYCRSVPFRGFENMCESPPSEMSSFSESDALKLIKDAGTNAGIIAHSHSGGESRKDLVALWKSGLFRSECSSASSGSQPGLLYLFICREALCETQQQTAEPDLPLWPAPPIIQL